MAGAVEAPRVAGTVEPLAVLHGDAPERGERFGLVQHPLGEVRVQPHPLPLAGGQRTRLVPDRVGHPEPAEAGDEPGAAQRLHVVGRQPELLAGAGGELGERRASGRACRAT